MAFCMTAMQTALPSLTSCRQQRPMSLIATRRVPLNTGQFCCRPPNIVSWTHTCAEVQCWVAIRRIQSPQRRPDGQEPGGLPHAPRRSVLHAPQEETPQAQ